MVNSDHNPQGRLPSHYMCVVFYDVENIVLTTQFSFAYPTSLRTLLSAVTGHIWKSNIKRCPYAGSYHAKIEWRCQIVSTSDKMIEECFKLNFMEHNREKIYQLLVYIQLGVGRCVCVCVCVSVSVCVCVCVCVCNLFC